MSMPDCCIDALDIDDLPRIERLYQRFGYGEKEHGYFEHHLKNNLVFIVHQGEKDCGFVILNRAPKYHLYARLGIFEIQDLNILPGSRRQGLAKALILYCERYVQKLDHPVIGISVGLSAAYGPAQRLYISMGYVPDGNGVTYDRQLAEFNRPYPLDDHLCLMMVKDLQ